MEETAVQNLGRFFGHKEDYIAKAFHVRGGEGVKDGG